MIKEDINMFDPLYKLDKQPDELKVYILYVLAQGQQESKECDPAIEKCEQALKFFQNKSDDYKFQCNLLQNETVTVTKDMLYEIMGLSYGGQNKFDSAIKYFKLAISINKNNKSVQENLQISYHKYGEYYFSKAWKLAEQNKEKVSKKSNKYYNQSIKYYKKSIELNPKCIQSYEKIGYAYYQLQDLGNAKKYLQKTLNLLPKNSKAYKTLLDKINEIDSIVKKDSKKDNNQNDVKSPRKKKKITKKRKRGEQREEKGGNGVSREGKFFQQQRQQQNIEVQLERKKKQKVVNKNTK